MERKSRPSSLPLLALAALTALLLTACGGGGEEQAAFSHNMDDWNWLQETRQSLDSNREVLSRLQDRLAGDEIAEGEEELSAEELQTRVTALETEINDLSADQFVPRLVDFINASIDGDGEGSDLHRQALALKSHEDIIIAQEFVDKGGEYGRALDVLGTAKRYDPDNPELAEAIANFETMQYMDEERFSQVRKGMSQREVQKLLGTAKRSNIREYEDKGTIAWFYRRADGGAAGVFFNEKNTGAGDWKVYDFKFGAVAAPEPTGGDEAASEG